MAEIISISRAQSIAARYNRLDAGGQGEVLGYALGLLRGRYNRGGFMALYNSMDAWEKERTAELITSLLQEQEDQ